MREWWWDEDLDAFRVYYDRPQMHGELGVAQELAPESTLNRFITPDQEDVFRFLGKPAGIFVLVFDGLKGFAACAWLVDIAIRFFSVAPVEEVYLRLIGGLAVVIGHNYTCWLRFKGGKGIATSAGVLAGIVPWALLIILSLWIIFFALTRYVSVGSLVASFTLPFATWFFYGDRTLTIVTGAMSALAIYKHKGNIQRLLNGTENRVGSPKKKQNKKQSTP